MDGKVFHMDYLAALKKEEDVYEVRPMSLIYENKNPLVRFIAEKEKKFIKAEIESGHNELLIDVGCGAGQIMGSCDLSETDLAVGVDFVENALQDAKKNLGNNFPLLRADAHFIPLEDNVADLLVCSSVLEHVCKPEMVVSELARVTKKGGKLVVVVPNEKLVVFLKSTAKKLHMPLFGLKEGMVPEHIQLSSEEWAKTLLSKEFKIEKVQKVPNKLLPIELLFVCTKF